MKISIIGSRTMLAATALVLVLGGCNKAADSGASGGSASGGSGTAGSTSSGSGTSNTTTPPSGTTSK